MYVLVSEENKEVEISGCSRADAVAALQSCVITHRDDTYNSYTWSTRGDLLVVYQGSSYLTTLYIGTIYGLHCSYTSDVLTACTFTQELHAHIAAIIFKIYNYKIIKVSENNS